MELGVDLSTYEHLAAFDPHYYYRGEEVEPLSFFHDHNGVTLLRLRVWLHPSSVEGIPYGAGNNDLACFLRLARLGMKKGYKILLNFHYSDFWVDPSKQTLPKAWRDYNFEQLVEAVYSYTKETLLTCRAYGIELHGIQIGNEITHGILWPFGALYNERVEGKGGGWHCLAELLKAGSKAAKEVYPEAKRVIHLEHSGSKDMQEEFFSHLVAEGLDFDVIGESYYPYWHGTFEELEENIVNLQRLFHKPVWIVEAGYAYSTEQKAGGGLEDTIDANFEATHNLPFPLTKEGQKGYVERLIALSKKLGVEEIYYWEPCWLTRPHCGWAERAGQEYLGVHGDPDANEWATETLFDESGEANPALDSYHL